MLTYTINCLTIVGLNIWGFSKIRKGALIIQRRKDAERQAAAQRSTNRRATDWCNMNRCTTDSCSKRTTDSIIPKDDENCKQFMRVG